MSSDYLWDGPVEGPLLVLAPGAGAPMRSRWMSKVAAAIGDAGLRVARFDFPYMREGRKAPDREPALLKAWLDVIEEIQPDAIGGKSLGGRIASMVADQLKDLIPIGTDDDASEHNELAWQPPGLCDLDAVLRAEARVEQGEAAWHLLNRLAKVYMSPEAEFPAPPGPGYLLHYTVKRVGGVGPWSVRG